REPRQGTGDHPQSVQDRDGGTTGAKPRGTSRERRARGSAAGLEPAPSGTSESAGHGSREREPGGGPPQPSPAADHPRGERRHPGRSGGRADGVSGGGEYSGGRHGHG